LGGDDCPNPTDRDKLGTKRHHVLTDGQGIPLSVVVTAANTHDMKAAIRTLNNIVVKTIYKMYEEKQNLYLDKGYDFPEIENGVIKKGYHPHVRHRDRKSGEPNVMRIFMSD
jgi:putative transposase